MVELAKKEGRGARLPCLPGASKGAFLARGHSPARRGGPLPHKRRRRVIMLAQPACPEPRRACPERSRRVRAGKDSKKESQAPYARHLIVPTFRRSLLVSAF